MNRIELIGLARVQSSSKSGFTDMSVNFNESAEFKCEVSEPDAKGKWFKDGKEVSPLLPNSSNIGSITILRLLLPIESR